MFDSWMSGSDAEVSGTGGDRDRDLTLDPDTCHFKIGRGMEARRTPTARRSGRIDRGPAIR